MIKTYFSSNSKLDELVIQYITKSKTTLKVAIFIFENDSISESFVEMKQKGVNINIIVDKRMLDVNNSAIQRLLSADVDLRVMDLGDFIMHHKFLISYDQVVLNGSYNYQYKATYGNLENLHVIRDQITIDDFQKEFDSLYHESLSASDYLGTHLSKPYSKIYFLLKKYISRKILFSIVFIQLCIIFTVLLYG